MFRHKNRMVLSTIGHVLACIMFFLLAGCAPPETGDYSRGFNVQKVDNKGLLSLFLTLQDPDGPSLSAGVEAIEILSENGNWYVLLEKSLELKTDDIRAGQKFLARASLVPGKYSQLRFIFGNVSIESETGEERPLTLENSQLVMNLHKPVFVGKNDSQSLFLNWDTKESVKTTAFLPIITVAPKLKSLIADVAFVACPEIDTVFLIRTDRNHVYDSIGIEGGVTYLFKTPRRNDFTVYSLQNKRAGINVFSPVANRVLEHFGLPMSAQSTFMALSPDGKWGYVIDEKRGDITWIEMNSGNILKSLRLGYDPSYIIYLEKYDLLAVTLRLSQTVLLLDPESLAQVGAVSTGSKPSGLFNDGNERLYIAESGGNSVLVYDLDRHENIQRIPVEFSPKRLLVSYDTLYVTNLNSRSVSVIKRGHTSASKTISLTGRPLEIAGTRSNQWIYVGNEGERAITIIEPITNKVAGKIELGAVPLGIEVNR